MRGGLRRSLLVETGPLLGTYTGKGKETYFAADGHPNARGYDAIARAVQRRLTSLGWIQ